MRNHRMRGYGAWCMGWEEGERNPGGPPPNNNSGCMLLFAGLVILLALSCFKVAFETGNGMGILLGIAVIAGLVKGMTK